MALEHSSHWHNGQKVGRNRTICRIEAFILLEQGEMGYSLFPSSVGDCEH